jgi:hypothetical protein
MNTDLQGPPETTGFVIALSVHAIPILFGAR